MLVVNHIPKIFEDELRYKGIECLELPGELFEQGRQREPHSVDEGTKNSRTHRQHLKTASKRKDECNKLTLDGLPNPNRLPKRRYLEQCFLEFDPRLAFKDGRSAESTSVDELLAHPVKDLETALSWAHRHYFEFELRGSAKRQNPHRRETLNILYSHTFE